MKDKKYAYGKIDYIQNPAEVFAQDDINKAKAMYEGNSNPLVLGMQTAGNMLIKYGMSGAMNGTGGDFDIDTAADNTNFQFGPSTLQDGMYAAMGGSGSAGKKIEVEGDEVFETESGIVGEFKGKKHEQGGIDVTLNEKTNIFSDRILVGGKSIADRKKQRENKLRKIENQLSNNPNDKITKNTYERTKISFDREEMKDLQTQNLIGIIMGQESEKAGLKAQYGLFDWFKTAFGGEEGEEGEGIGTTFGDVLSIGGNMFSGIAPLLNTLKNRASDTPNINAFENFGQDALDANEQSKDYIEGVRDNQLKDIDRSVVGAKRTARQGSRSINTQRATDLTIDQSANQSKENIYDTFAKQMLGVFSQESQLENQQDHAVMTGEQLRDENDRKDKDAFFTNKAQNLASLGQAIQQTGKDLNQAEQQKVIKKLLDQLSKYGITFDSDFNLQNPK